MGVAASTPHGDIHVGFDGEHCQQAFSDDAALLGRFVARKDAQRAAQGEQFRLLPACALGKFGESLDEALKKAAAECVAACPTAALAWAKGST